MRRTLLALAALLVLAGPSPAHAATVTVKPGDGTLQAALDAAQDGDVLELRSGVYRGSFTRSDIADLTIRARGRVVLDARPRNRADTVSSTVLTFTRVAGLTIEGLTIRNPTNDAIFLQDCSGFVLRRCKLEKCGDSGVEDQNTAGYTVEGCSIRKCNWGLATGYGTSASGVSITKTRFSQIGDYAIDLWADDAVVQGNTIVGGEATGIYLRDGFSGASVTRNRIGNLGGYGILADGDSHTISLNGVRNVQRDGIALTGALGGNTLEDNVVLRARANGFVIASSGNRLTRNKASRSREFDLQSDVDAAQNTFDGNVFKETSFPAP